MFNLTPKELKLVNAILNSDYRDIETPNEIHVWLPTPQECGFENNKVLSGVVSTLTKKNVIYTDGTGNDITVGFTKEYAETIKDK